MVWNIMWTFWILKYLQYFKKNKQRANTVLAKESNLQAGYASEPPAYDYCCQYFSSSMPQIKFDKHYFIYSLNTSGQGFHT